VETVAHLWPRAFGGQWGHKHVDTDTARALASSGDGVFIGLREHGQWTGLCRVEPADRLIDGPGFADRPRTPARAAGNSCSWDRRSRNASLTARHGGRNAR
jgi:hypothetical protein